jgi:hypothetical protein
MTIFVPETTAQAWVRAELVGSAPVIAALGNNQIYPNIAPPEVTGRHISHWFYGPSGGESVFPIGRGLIQVCMTWRVTGWEPSYSQQALEPVMKAVMVALVGPEGRGRTARFAHDSMAFTIECRYIGPDVAPMASVPTGMWAPLHHLYDLTVRPVA